MPARCRACRRPITDPESLTLGLGPDCARKRGLRLHMPAQRNPVGDGQTTLDLEETSMPDRLTGFLWPTKSDEISGCCDHPVNLHGDDGCTYGWKYNDAGDCTEEGCGCPMRAPAWGHPGRGAAPVTTPTPADVLADVRTVLALIDGTSLAGSRPDSARLAQHHPVIRRHR